MLYEDTESLVKDTALNRAITDVLHELPRRGVYREKIYKKAFVVDRLDYALPSLAIECELVETNLGTTNKPDWQETVSWETYNNVLYFKARPTTTDTFRVHLQMGYTDLTDDVATTDVPDSQIRVVAAGAVLKAYEMLMGYFLRANNWDANAKPGATEMVKLANWIKQADERYEKLLRTFRKYPKARTIDLVN